PLLEPADIAALLACFEAEGSALACVPRHAGQRGNPVVLPRAVARMLRDSPGEPSVRGWLDRHPQAVPWFESATDPSTPAAPPPPGSPPPPSSSPMGPPSHQTNPPTPLPPPLSPPPPHPPPAPSLPPPCPPRCPLLLGKNRPRLSSCRAAALWAPIRP